MTASEKPHLLTNGPGDGSITIALAHGAGAGMDTEFMNVFAEGIAQVGFRVVRFEFPYMAEGRRTGKRRPPDREAILCESWQQVIAALETETLVIGGKSMGGRMASLIADEAKVAGLVCLGYPFHPTGKPDRLRTAHLEGIKTPTLIVQGERDTLGNQEEVAGYKLSRRIQMHWLPDGDHNFKPRKRSGRTLEDNWGEGVEAVVRFVGGLRIG